VDMDNPEKTLSSCITNVCQPGKNLLAAGYVLYSSCTILVRARAAAAAAAARSSARRAGGRLLAAVEALPAHVAAPRRPRAQATQPGRAPPSPPSHPPPPPPPHLTPPPGADHRRRRVRLHPGPLRRRVRAHPRPHPDPRGAAAAPDPWGPAGIRGPPRRTPAAPAARAPEPRRRPAARARGAPAPHHHQHTHPPHNPAPPDPPESSPQVGKIYAFNEGNYALWDDGTRAYIDSLKDPAKWGGKPYSARYIGSLVGDFHRTLLYGGIYGGGAGGGGGGGGRFWGSRGAAARFRGRVSAAAALASARSGRGRGARSGRRASLPPAAPPPHTTHPPPPPPPTPQRLPRRQEEHHRQAAPAVRVRPDVDDRRAGRRPRQHRPGARAGRRPHQGAAPGGRGGAFLGAFLWAPGLHGGLAGCLALAKRRGRACPAARHPGLLPPSAHAAAAPLPPSPQVHQRVPLFVGSKKEVEYLESFVKGKKN
jgi:hypothetical protein